MASKIQSYAVVYAIGMVVCALTVRAQQTAATRDTSLVARFNQAVDLFNEHDDSGDALADAEKEFLFILKENPCYAPALAYLGLIALEREQPEIAATYIGQSLAINANCPEARIAKARLLRAQQQWEAGLNELRHAVLLSPTSVFALSELAMVLLHSAEQQPPSNERLKEALPYLKKIIELDHDARQAHFDLAESYERLGQFHEAVTHYREVLRIGQIPGEGDVWVYTVHKTVANCLEKLRDYEQAWKELELYLKSLKELGADDKELSEVEQNIRELQKKAKK